MIVCVGLTPTVQRTLFFDSFTVGGVNRIRRILITASGKAVNVARIITTLGGEAQLVQPLGGESGRLCAALLTTDTLVMENLFVEDDAPTRTCTTLLAPNTPTTEIVEEAPPLCEADLKHIANAVMARLWGASAVCLSGSLPPGVPPTFYATVAKWATNMGIPVVVDAQKAPLLEALKERPYLVKPNVDEAFAALGLTRTANVWKDAVTAATHLREAGAENALVSLGKTGALLASHRGELIRLIPPTVDAVNPIGSGDSLTGGTAYARFERGRDLVEAVRYGTACAAANCLTETSGVIDPEQADRLFDLVRIET